LSSSNGFASPRKATFDHSPYVFDSNSDKHNEFCASLKGLQVFKDALKEDEELEKEEGGESTVSSSRSFVCLPDSDP